MRYRTLAREEVGRFGGAEIKTEGDSFYVVFDSVSNAVRCGLAITSAARASDDQPIRVGVGIHAGETIEADGGYVGSPVNIAARICAQAGPGEVLVSETVRALTMTLLPVHFKSRGRRQLKGVTDPIELFAVEEAAAGANAWPSAPRRRLSRRARVALAGGGVIVAAAAAGIGWVLLQPSTGLAARAMDDRRAGAAEWPRRLVRHCHPKRGAARRRPGKRGRRGRRRATGLEGIRRRP
jgi:hypothetical protein